MIPTPDTSHLTREDYKTVYEPAEDTFILLDALEKDASRLRRLHPLVCVEIGSGSGCVSSFLGFILGSSNALYVCTDINQHATKCTAATGQQNDIKLESVVGHLVSPIASRLAGSVDILVFNPPYVPTTEDEFEYMQDQRGIGGAWAGGTYGMDLTNQLLPCVTTLLSQRGSFYLVAIKQNDIPFLRQRMLQQYGLSSEILLDRRAGREHLFVLRCNHDLTDVRLCDVR